MFDRADHAKKSFHQKKQKKTCYKRKYNRQKKRSLILPFWISLFEKGDLWVVEGKKTDKIAEESGTYTKNKNKHNIGEFVILNIVTLLISKCKLEKLCLTREFQQSLFCKQTSLAISKNPFLHKKSKGGNTCVTWCIS